MFNRFILINPESFHDRSDPLRTKDAHQIIFQRQEERASARVTLTARTAAQLVVDPAALVALGGENVEPAGVERLLAFLLAVGPDFGFQLGDFIVVDDGKAAVFCRDTANNLGLMVRQTGDAMIMAPPLVCEPEHIDMLLDRLGQGDHGIELVDLDALLCGVLIVVQQPPGGDALAGIATL